MNEISLIANNPVEMAQAQHDLVAWVDGKLRTLKGELNEAEESLKIAKERKWVQSRWQRVVRHARARVIFYQKMLTVVKAGYYIVPPFPDVDWFAVRTKRTAPKGNPTTSPFHDFRQRPERLPENEGRYVSAHPEVWQKPVKRADQKTGEIKEVALYGPEHLCDVDFPITFAKPQLLQKLSEAMKRNVFDAIGLLPQRSGGADPIIVGLLRHPTSQWHDDGVQFFIGYWLDTSDLP